MSEPLTLKQRGTDQVYDLMQGDKVLLSIVRSEFKGFAINSDVTILSVTPIGGVASFQDVNRFGRIAYLIE